jgi:hypothetical protein
MDQNFLKCGQGNFSVSGGCFLENLLLRWFLHNSIHICYLISRIIVIKDQISNQNHRRWPLAEMAGVVRKVILVGGWADFFFFFFFFFFFALLCVTVVVVWLVL